MDTGFLGRHKFQFISFCHVIHSADYTAARIHINDDHHILHVARGSGALWVENDKFPLQPGAVAAIPPFVRFYFRTAAPFEMLNIHFRLWLENGVPLEEYAALPVVFRPPCFSVVKAILLSMKGSPGNDHPRHSFRSSLAHQAVILHLVSNKLVKTDRPIIDARLLKACRRLSSPDYSSFHANELARLCGLSTSQMNRLFQKCFGMSPHKFWEHKRFAELCRQLRATGNTVSEIALQAGMGDAAYFSRWFKKMAGCAPVEFRRCNI